jgi:hypothetical protein
MNKKNILICIFAVSIVIVGLALYLYVGNQNNDVSTFDNSQNSTNEESIQDISDENSVDNDSGQNLVVIFHNGAGPMCLEAIEFFQEYEIEYREHLNSDSDFRELLNENKSLYDVSEGVSNTFGYYPIIFINNRAFSGFSELVKNEILIELDM